MAPQRAQVEAVIKTIIRRITEKCANLGHSLSEALVAFMVKAIVIDPTNGLSVERPLTDNDISELIDNSVKLLTDKKSCSLETVKMQVFFDMNYTSREEMLEEHSIVTSRRLTPMSREICDSKARTRNDFDSLYRKMVAYVILASGLGSPTDIMVVRETTAALQSVYPQTELANFVALQYHDKQVQLEELCQIVTGIRLFNKECNKGGSGIEDLPKILNESLPSTTKSIDDALADAQETSYKITSFLLSDKVPNKSEAQRKLLLSVLYNRRQFEMYIRALMNDIILSARSTEATINEVSERMEFLKQTVQSKTAVPTGQVYPLFIAIARCWKKLQEEIVLVGITANTVTQLASYQSVCKEQLPDFELNKLLQENEVEVVTDVKRAEVTENQAAPEDGSAGSYHELIRKELASDLELIDAQNCPNINQIKFDLSGFCPITLIDHQGLVLPGLPHLGLLRYRENFYVTASNQAKGKFLNNDANTLDDILTHVNSLAAQSPELIGLIGLSRQFTGTGKYTGAKSTRPMLKRDSGCQTDTHFQPEGYIDKEYHWNEWELRRKAIRLSNLTHRVTHSTQTTLSHFKRENETQVYLPKVNGTQTKRENWSSVPQPKVFYAGLRGVRGPRNFRKLDITLEK